jgi:hypothetical protein
MLGDVPEVGATGQGAAEPARLACRAVVVGQPRKQGQQARGEPLGAGRLLPGQLLEFKPGHGDRACGVDVRAVQAAQVDKPHVCSLA